MRPFKRASRPSLAVLRLSLVAASLMASAAGAMTFGSDTRSEEAKPSGKSAREQGAEQPKTGLSALIGATAKSAPDFEINPVREAALRDTARTLGAQFGLGERSRQILKEVEAMGGALDKKYKFGALMLGRGILPAAIDEVSDPLAVEGDSFRIAHRIYHINEPARPVLITPTWRDWLYQGLDADLNPVPPDKAQLLPQNDAERRFWEREIRAAYAEGVRVAQSIFDLNLARLERTYLGMRRFYELHARGMVTWPVVASASSIVDKTDPNTIVVGSTVFRITAPTEFVTDTEQWEPLGK